MKGCRPPIIITRVIVFLLLGAIVNVAVAWACAAWVVPRSGTKGFYLTKDKTPRWGFSMGTGFGSTRIFSMNANEYFEYAAKTELASEMPPYWSRVCVPPNTPPIDTVDAIWEEARGWPFLSLLCTSTWGDERRTVPLVGGGWSSGGVPVYENGIKLVTIFDPTTGHAIDRCLPLRVLWPGLAINTIFYAAILWLLFYAPGSVRRALRRRRGLCPACAYPVGTSPVCTECGGTVKRSAISDQRSVTKNQS